MELNVACIKWLKQLRVIPHLCSIEWEKCQVLVEPKHPKNPFSKLVWIIFTPFIIQRSNKNFHFCYESGKKEMEHCSKTKSFNALACLIRPKKARVEWRNRTCIPVDTFFRRTTSPPSTSINSIYFVRWHSPAPGLVKLNLDGSLINSSAAGGYILRNWTGRVLYAGSPHYSTSSILVEDVRAMRVVKKKWL